MTLISFVTNNLVPSVLDFLKVNEYYNLSTYKLFGLFDINSMLMSIPDIINFVYILAVFSIIVFSCLVNHNNKKFKVIYYGASTLFGFYGILVLILLFYNAYSIINETANSTNILEQEQFLIPLIYLRALILFVIVGFALPIIWTMSFRKTV